MSVSLVHTRATLGISAPSVTVEVHLSPGLPRISIVGLPETVVRESCDRVRSAILNARFEFPVRRITINLAPADLPKSGSRFDLPIAIGILHASGQLKIENLQKMEFLGELTLSGALRSVEGILPAVQAVADAHRELFLPQANISEAALVSSACLFPAQHLLEVCAHLSGQCALPRGKRVAAAVREERSGLDLRHVLGQEIGRRAMEIAAAGAHNMLFVGPPGAGKTTLAIRMPSILPPLAEKEVLEVAMIYSLVGSKPYAHGRLEAPFRAPHHTASAVALVGGGSNPLPGEISLAHCGVLFLDELPEFPRNVLEVLREPMESGEILIARAKRKALFPARFQLLAAMNPCPCGYYGDLRTPCRCTANQLLRYRNRISGPFHDRIDLRVQVQRIPATLMSGVPQDNESSAVVRQRVLAARIPQQRRGVLNANLSGALLNKHCALAKSESDLLGTAAEKLDLSMRGCHRVLRVARTIADLNEEKQIRAPHLHEALSYRDYSPTEPSGEKMQMKTYNPAF